MTKKTKPAKYVWRVVYVALIVVLLITAAGVFNYYRPLPKLKPVYSFTPSIPAASTLNWPSASEAAIGAVGYGLLASNGSQTPLPTASVAKLITSLAVLQKYPLTLGQQGPTITLNANDMAIYNQYVSEDGSVASVQVGEQITEYQALQAMLLPSANNMADSLAIWAYGSLPSYSSYANQFVSTLGLTNTHIGSDASGFLPNTTSTANDLVTLGMKVLANPVLAQIVSQSTATIPVAGVIHNVNFLLGTDGIFGIKTGNTNQAGGVYLFAAHDILDASHTVTIVGAVQGAPNLQASINDAVPLLNSAKKNFSLNTVVQAGQVVGKYVTPWKTTVHFISESNLQTIVWGGNVPKITISAKDEQAPLINHTVVGYISDNNTKVNLITNSSLSKPNLMWTVMRHNW